VVSAEASVVVEREVGLRDSAALIPLVVAERFSDLSVHHSPGGYEVPCLLGGKQLHFTV
jgi:hypothetical protein